MTLDFSVATLGTRKQLNNSIKNFMEYTFQPGVLYLARLSVQCEGRIKTSSPSHRQLACLKLS